MNAQSFNSRKAAFQAAIEMGLHPSAVVKTSAKKWAIDVQALAELAQKQVSYVDHAIPHDLAEGEADQSCPVAIDEMSDEDFARIMINGGKEPKAKKAATSTRTRSGTYVYPSKYPTKEGACKLIWDTLTALWQAQGKPEDFAITAKERETIRTELGVQKSTMNMQFLCWRKWAGIEVAGRASSQGEAQEHSVSSEPVPTSIDDVEVTEV